MPPTEKEFKASNFCPWPLFSKEDLVLRSPSRLWRPKPGDQSAAGTTPRSTPKSRQEGMTQKMENAQMKTAIELILKAAQALKLHFAVPTAIMFLRRYYSVKAVQENDRFIVVCACVFLAAKCEEEPRNLNDVCYQIFKFRYSDNAEALQNMREALFFAHFREVVLTAERSLLYALGFQLGIHHPYYWITSILSRLSKLPGEDGAWWAAYSTRTAKSRTNFVNDMYKGTSLILRYDLRILAFAVMHITIPVMYPDINRPKADHDKVPLIDLQPWYSYVLKTEKIETEESDTTGIPSKQLPSHEPEQKVTSVLLVEVGKEIMGLYTKTKKAGPGQAPGAAEAKLDAPEVVGPDGPIMPMLEEFGTPGSEGSGVSPAQAKQVANGAAPAPEVTRSPASKAGLDPSAPAFVPGAAQHSPCRAAASPAQAASQQHSGQAGKKRSSEDAGLEELAPSKRVVPDKITESALDSCADNAVKATADAQCPAPQHSLQNGHIPSAQRNGADPLHAEHAEAQCNGSSTPAAAMQTEPSLANGPSAAAGLGKQSSMISEEGELIAEMQALEDAGNPAAPADPAAAGERLRKWQEGQRRQQQQADEDGRLEAELEGLDAPARPKQAPTNAAAASERLKKWQQLQAAAVQNGH